MDWIFKGKPALAVPKGKIGFVYITRYSDDSYYIGKKLCESVRLVPAIKSTPKEDKIFRVIVRGPDGKICVTKEQKKEARSLGFKGKKEAYRYIIGESKWREYEGSAELKGGYTLVEKEILAWCNTQIGMTFIEADLQIRNNVLFDEKCLNQNILGKFYPNVLDGEKLNEED